MVPNKYKDLSFAFDLEVIFIREECRGIASTRRHHSAIKQDIKNDVC